MCKARVALRCPNCKRKLEVTISDSLHPLCSLEKPGDDEVESDVVTQRFIPARILIAMPLLAFIGITPRCS